MLYYTKTHSTKIFQEVITIEEKEKKKRKKRSKRKTLRMLKNAFKIAGADKIIIGYIAWFLLAAVPIWIWEPNIKSYGDSLWFCFASATTIGYGDVSAVTIIGRIITVILSVYSLAVVAIFTGVVTSFFTDLSRIRAVESSQELIDDLEHLQDLSKEELADLSRRIKELQRR